MVGDRSHHGMVAAGHEATAEAATQVLAEGGNAFDAVVAGVFAACICEPMLASLGGGGFLLACPARRAARVYDFFTHTPRRKRLGDLDFHAIDGDFGGVVQQFHIGMGAIATPGMLKGLFRIRRDLARLPMAMLMAPAMALAREGVVVNSLQAYSRQVLDPIVRATPEARRVFAGDPAHRRQIVEGARFCMPELADCLEALAREGDALLYRGELGRSLIADCLEHGGHLLSEDLAHYRVAVRKPLVCHRGQARLLLNPPPSLGGSLIAFTLDLLKPRADLEDRGARLASLVRALDATDDARLRLAVDARAMAGRRRLIGKRASASYRRAFAAGLIARRGTTHISVIDRQQNVASATVSNGEGCGYVLPGTGIMLNNMLGEQDLAAEGLQGFAENRRLSSMMCPTVVEHADVRQIALGSGGSNRIRSALVQVLLGLLDEGLDPHRAVHRPRLHFEGQRLEIEPGLAAHELAPARALAREVHAWSEPNMYFGGVQVVERNARTGVCRGAGDPRRGGVVCAV